MARASLAVVSSIPVMVSLQGSPRSRPTSHRPPVVQPARSADWKVGVTALRTEGKRGKTVAVQDAGGTAAWVVCPPRASVAPPRPGALLARSRRAGARALRGLGDRAELELVRSEGWAVRVFAWRSGVLVVEWRAMKLSHGIHLAYCTNIHRGESWAETLGALERHTLAVRARVCPDRPYAIGLRLSDQALRELSDKAALLAFRRWLDSHGCYVFTINGFPYGRFHGGRVKEQVYVPDWTTREHGAL